MLAWLFAKKMAHNRLRTRRSALFTSTSAGSARAPTLFNGAPDAPARGVRRDTHSERHRLRRRPRAPSRRSRRVPACASESAERATDGNRPSHRFPRSSPQRNIELGRVCLVNLAADPLYGKLVTIVDFVDMNRVRLLSSPGLGCRASRRSPRASTENPKPPSRRFPQGFSPRGGDR